jgi:hypothetical protein
MNLSRIEPGPFLVDAHVHFHECFDAHRFLDAAARNIRRASLDLGLSSETRGVLMFADPRGMNSFKRLTECAPDAERTVWRFVSTSEKCSLIARRDSSELVLVAGRQIATRERLEVLALGTTRSFPDGLGLMGTLRTVLEGRALAVVPWGFGKWWGRRGRLVQAVIQSPEYREIFLADNGGRPRVGLRSRLLRLAKRIGINILPGTDPLPFLSEECRTGSFGFVLAQELDMNRPTSALKRGLMGLDSQPRVFGRRSSQLAFVRNQARLILLRRSGHKKPCQCR